MKTPRILIVAVLTAGLAEPAHADGWYVGVGLAPAWLGTDFKYADGSRVFPELNTSFMISGAVGYKWLGIARFEAEPYWTVSNTHKATVSGALADNPSMTVTKGNEAQIDGDVRARGILFNGAYDIPLGNHFALTVGGGVGSANVSPSISTVKALSIADVGQSSVAWQLIIGVTYAMDSNFELQVDYRYTGIADTDHDSSFAAINPVSAKHTDIQAIMFNVRWYPWSND